MENEEYPDWGHSLSSDTKLVIEPAEVTIKDVKLSRKVGTVATDVPITEPAVGQTKISSPVSSSSPSAKGK